MSKLSVSCPSCAKRYGVPEEHAGKKFKCKDCGATISIPALARAAEPEEPVASDEDEPAPPSRKKSTPHRRPARRRPPPASRRRATRSGPDEADEEPAGARHRRGGARRTTGGRSTRGRRGAHAHAHDDEYEGREYGGRSQQPNKGLLILSAVGSLVLLVALLVYFALPGDSGTSGKRTKKRTAAAKTEGEFVPPKIVTNPEDDDPGFGEGGAGGSKEPDPAPAPVAAKKPENKPENKPAKAEPKKPSLPPIPRAKIRKLDHLASTSAEMRQEIDEAVEKLKDPWSGAKGSRAKQALIKIGKPSVPALLSAMVDLDFANEDARKAMPLLTETLQEITKEINSRVCRVGMQSSEAEEIHYCKYFRADWFNWYDGRQGKRYMGE